MFTSGDFIKTPYGQGVVQSVRKTHYVVELTSWTMDRNQKPTIYLNKSDAKPVFREGDAVQTVFGVGKIESIRDGAGASYVVRLDNWKLATGRSPFLYLDEKSLRKLPVEKPAAAKATVPEKTFDERFLSVKKVKDEGNALFKESDFENAKEKYAQCINELNVRRYLCCNSLYQYIV
jgi:hypothetical protein